MALANLKQSAEVHFQNVAHSFAGKAVVQSLNLRIERGEFVSLLGPSGCGKSTILKLMAELLQPTEGSISLIADELPVSKAFVFQEPALLPWRTVLRNAALPLELRGESRAVAEEKALHALTRVGLQDAIERYPNQLSGGMKMRVSVARALVAQPSLLLLDEPFAALDETNRFRLQEDLRKLWSETGLTTVFVTHSASEAAFLSNRAIVFSPRPARVSADLNLDLPPVRTKELRTSQEFQMQVRLLTQALEAGGAQ